jgi:hypothetical protein
MRIGKFTYDGSLRPMLVMNIILVVLFLGAFGIAHTWLGMRQREKEKEINRLADIIQRTDNEIRRLDSGNRQRTNNGPLFSRMESLGVKLRHIDPAVDEILTVRADGSVVSSRK